ncbi:PREDICTED: arabinogalactan peptide 23 [Theobroma cacao]|uniref:Arabinogalactan peptide 23 n=1 Tax=Theobroma cacao TaxID=3641 RepID=A0AB32W9Q8_THECC|nr:PREDICTED: arabinogalactan peptide 23 [Theobroma cacao]
MDMKKISCAVIVAAASMSAVLASTDNAPAAAPGPAASAASSALPVLGSLVGASLVSFFAYCLQ